MGKRKKVRQVLLNTTARSILNQYLETLSSESQYLFPSEKTQRAQTELALVVDLSPPDQRHHFGYRMVALIPLCRLAQIMGHDSLDTTMLYIRGTKQDLQHNMEKITWI